MTTYIEAVDAAIARLSEFDDEPDAAALGQRADGA
jgi:hypothetical protein